MFVNNDFEHIVLGSLLLEPKIIDDYYFYPDLFYSDNNKIIFNTIVSCIENGVNPDIVIVGEKLKDKISIAYISSLTSKVTQLENLEYYVNELDELNKKRKIERVLKVCAAGLKQKPAQEIIEQIETGLVNLCEEKQKGYQAIRNYTTKAIERIEKKYNREYTGIKTGWRNADYLIEELPTGTLNIIAARTSLGKTAVCLNVAGYLATKEKRKVGIFSCEMSGDLLAERIIQKLALVNTRKCHELKKEGFLRIQDACNAMYNLPIYIDDTPNIYLYSLKSKARKMKREGIEIIFIDYLGLIRYQNEKLSLYEKYGAISKELKQLARELELPIVALHQLNREAEGQKPTLDQLRNSGAIEEDADLIVLMSGKRKDENMELTFDVAKNRFGAAGECKLLFKKEYQLITDVARDET